RTRQSIVKAGLELFSRQGFDETRVEEIADACGVSKRTFFRYFPAKEDILFADAPELSAALIALLRAQPRQISSAAALHFALRAVAPDYASARQHLLLRTKVLRSSGSLRAYQSEHQLGWHDAILATLREREAARAWGLSLFELHLLTNTSLAAVHTALTTWLD